MPKCYEGQMVQCSSDESDTESSISQTEGMKYYYLHRYKAQYQHLRLPQLREMHSFVFTLPEPLLSLKEREREAMPLPQHVHSSYSSSERIPPHCAGEQDQLQESPVGLL